MESFVPFQAVWDTGKSGAETLNERSWEWYVWWSKLCFPRHLESLTEISLTCDFLYKVSVIPVGYVDLFREP